jgi:hypothetical protein
MKKMLLSVVFGAFLFPTVASAETLSEALLECSKEKNSLKRLVCFDNVTKDVKQYEDGERPAFVIPGFSLSGNNEQASNARPTASNKNVASAPSSSTAPTPSAEGEDISRLGLPKVVKRDIDKGEKIYMTVAEARRDKNRKWVLKFENGQEWRQTDTVSIKVEAGDAIYIERGTFGSFFLSKDDVKKRIRIKRNK